MKIAYLGMKGLPAKGGPERVVEGIVGPLKDRHEITVYCNADYTPPGTTLAGIRLIRIPSLRGKHTRMLITDLLAALHAFVFGNYDLIHLHNAEAGFVLPLLRLRYKVISTSHTLAYTADKWGPFARFLMRLADFPFKALSNCITCVTPSHEPFYAGYRPVFVIPNGVDPPSALITADVSDLLAAQGVDERPFVLFVAGRIIPFKGAHLLLDAFRRVELNWQLVVLGDRQQLPEYGQSLADLADERVRFIPFIGDKATVLGLIRRAALYVHPSTNQHGMEGMPMTLLEALSLGTPALCSDIPQHQFILQEYGYYFRADDIEDLATRLRWAMEHPEEMQTTAEAACRHVHEHFAWRHIAQQYDQLYTNIAGKKMPAG